MYNRLKVVLPVVMLPSIFGALIRSLNTENSVIALATVNKVMATANKALTTTNKVIATVTKALTTQNEL